LAWYFLLTKIDQEGNIIDGKKYKKNQIELDKKHNEEKFVEEQMQREMNNDIEVLFFYKGRVEITNTEKY
jgi:hypothetical protein